MLDRNFKEIVGNESKRPPIEEIIKNTPSLLNSALLQLGKTQEFKVEAVKNYLHEIGSNRNEPIEFNRNGYAYRVLLSREVTRDSLVIHRAKDGIREKIELYLTYGEEYGGSFISSGRRSQVDTAVVSHMVFDGSKKNAPIPIQIANTQEALDKTSEFISSI